MSFANASVSDIVASTIEARSKSVADSVTKNNALLARLEQGDKIKTVSGGTSIMEPVSFAENGNAGYYAGYDLLPVAAQDVISAATYLFKQAAVPVVISGLEQLQNNGKEAIFDLLEARIAVAEASMRNLITSGIYSNGTGSGGKQITGLDAAVEATVPASQTSTYGNISRASWSFWRNYYSAPAGAATAANIQGRMNTCWVNLVRGSDTPDLVVADSNYFALYLASLQSIQRFTDPKLADLGFSTVKYMTSDVVLDGGIGGFATTNTMYFLNTKYLKWRPHRDRNFVPLSPERRYAINQDATVQILAWAGNLVCSGAKFQGRLSES